MLSVVLAILILGCLLYLVYTRLPANTLKSNLIMFGLGSISGLIILTLFAFQIEIVHVGAAVAVAVAVVVPSSLLFGYWFGFGRQQIKNLLS